MPLRELEPGVFKSDFNRRPFQIKHDLVGHPAFALERLVELAAKLPSSLVEYNAGDLPLTQDPTKTPQTGLSIEETIRRIVDCKSWMVLKRVEKMRCVSVNITSIFFVFLVEEKRFRLILLPKQFIKTFVFIFYIFKKCLYTFGII